MRRVGFVILGSNGYIANDCAFQCLPRARERLWQDGIDLVLSGVADPAYFRFADKKTMEEAYAKLRENMSKLNPCAIIPDGNDAVTLVTGDINRTGLASGDATIIYDGTPTVRHSSHFADVLKSGASSVFYFGEKPIFLDPIFLNGLKRTPDSHPLYCDFIETQNPAVEAISQDIVARNLRITKLEFWRSGASGIKHIFGHTQAGVQGGSLLDKGPHDLSICVRLLGPENITGSVVSPDHAHFHSFIPRFSPTGAVEFLDAKNHWREQPHFDFKSDPNGDRLSLIADGLSQFGINWQLSDGRSVPSEMLFGWLGYGGHFNQSDAHPAEQRFVNIMRELEIPDSEWLLVEDAIGTGGQKFTETQVRLAIIHVEGSDGAHARYISNFIASKERPGRPQIRRWTRHVNHNGNVTSIFEGNNTDYHSQKIDDMAQVFCKVVRDALGDEEAPFLNSKATLLVHDALLQARDNALRNAERDHKQAPMDHSATLAFIKRCTQPS